MNIEQLSNEGLNEVVNSSEQTQETSIFTLENSSQPEKVLTTTSECNEVENISLVEIEKKDLKLVSISETNKNSIVDSANLQKAESISGRASRNYDVVLDQCRELTSDEVLEETIYDFALTFAKNCNYLGIPQNVSSFYALLKLKFSQAEISDCFEQVYIENTGDFAKFADIESLKEWKMENNEGKNNTFLYDFSSPFIPDFIFNNLPDLLKKTCAVFESERERDVFFIGALGVLSGCLPNTSGVYYGSTVYPNLYGLIIAPPASGKGVLKYSKALAVKYHNKIVDESRKLRKDYDDRITLLNRNKKRPIIAIRPQEPPFKVVFIPGNTSLSMLVKHLENNSGEGIICESEADTMGNANKQDWGDYSPLLRVAFHHESYALSRKANQEYLEVLEPKISVVLTGTPSQLPNLINSVQDGLFSRFIFYSYISEPIWNNPSQLSFVNLNEYFNQIGEEVYDMVEYLRKYPTKVHLSSVQWEVFNSRFEVLLKETNFLYGDDTISIVRRLGLVVYRICMILTAINKVQNGDLTEQLECTDEDFSIALNLSEIFLQHSITAFKTIPKTGKFEKNKINYRAKLINELPDEFVRKDAIALAEKFKVSIRTIDLLLQEEEGKLIEKVRAGLYKKL